MKNVQVIDGATNCTYSIYQFTDEQFASVFPDPGQDIEFINDMAARLSEEEMEKAFEGVWDRPIRKSKVNGIHGTLFYQLEFKKEFYPNKSERKDMGGPPHSPLSHLRMWDGENT